MPDHPTDPRAAIDHLCVWFESLSPASLTQLGEFYTADARFKEIPVCILSTSSDEGDMQRAKDLGALAYMIKPPTLQQLEQALEGVDSLELQPRGDALVLCAEQSRQSPTALV